MTGQIPDTVIYKGEEYDLFGAIGSGMPSPLDFGLVPGPMHTACWRGFYVTYKVDNNRLYLDEMTIRTSDGKYPEINGVPAIQEDYNMVYHNINLELPFSGKMQIGKDFIQEKYVHMGFQPPSSYRTVLVLNFDNGILTGKDK